MQDEFATSTPRDESSLDRWCYPGRMSGFTCVLGFVNTDSQISVLLYIWSFSGSISCSTSWTLAVVSREMDLKVRCLSSCGGELVDVSRSKNAMSCERGNIGRWCSYLFKVGTGGTQTGLQPKTLNHHFSSFLPAPQQFQVRSHVVDVTFPPDKGFHVTAGYFVYGVSPGHLVCDGRRLGTSLLHKVGLRHSHGTFLSDLVFIQTESSTQRASTPPPFSVSFFRCLSQYLPSLQVQYNYSLWAFVFMMVGVVGFPLFKRHRTKHQAIIIALRDLRQGVFIRRLHSFMFDYQVIFVMLDLFSLQCTFNLRSRDG